MHHISSFRRAAVPPSRCLAVPLSCRPAVSPSWRLAVSPSTSFLLDFHDITETQGGRKKLTGGGFFPQKIKASRIHVDMEARKQRACIHAYIYIYINIFIYIYINIYICIHMHT